MKKKTTKYLYDDGTLINKLNIHDPEKLKRAESDIVTVRIHEVIKGGYFEPSEEYLKELHKYLFSDVYPFAGQYRDIQIYKEEQILARLSIEYAHPDDINFRIKELLELINETNFNDLNQEEKLNYITNIVVSLWQIHPFREGNTRTTLLYMRQLLKSYGLSFNEYFFKPKGNFEYTRNALVAACFESEIYDKQRNYTYIRKVIGDILDSSTYEKKLK